VLQDDSNGNHFKVAIVSIVRTAPSSFFFLSYVATLTNGCCWFGLRALTLTTHNLFLVVSERVGLIRNMSLHLCKNTYAVG